MNIKDIKNKLEILNNINKLTNTLSMISMSKLNKYSKYLITLRLLHLENKKIMFEICNFNKLNKSCCIILTANKGLCGNFNNEIIKKSLKFLKNNNVDIFVVGKKGYEFFRKKKINIENYIIFENEPLEINFPNDIINKLIMYKSIYYISSKYEKNRINVSINNLNYNNKFKDIEYINLNKNEFLKFYHNNSLKYFYLESFFCELKSRMITMKFASDNSKKIIKDMKILKNKIRQFKVTTDMLEIINGNL